MFKKIIRIYFMICALLLGACQTNTSSTTLALLDKVTFTFEAKKSIIINHSNQNPSSSNHIMDGTFLKPEKPSDQNQETDHKIVEETTPEKPPIPYKNEATDDVIGFYDTTIEQEVIELVNDLRLQLGLKAVEQSESLTTTARLKSEDMAKYNYFSHEDLNGNLITTQMKKDGVSYKAWGENIAYIGGNVSADTLAQQFMTNWMNSSGHRENILSTKFSSIGVGVKKIGNKVYATQEFYR